MQKLLCFAVVTFCLLTVAGCVRRDCDKHPRPYAGLSFELVDKNTGQPLYTVPGTLAISAPDSIQLRNLGTQQVYTLRIESYEGRTSFSVADYTGKQGAADLLELRFGGAAPDTFKVTIGTIEGWRGDECGSVNDPGVTQVTYRGNLIYTYLPNADSAFVLRK